VCRSFFSHLNSFRSEQKSRKKATWVFRRCSGRIKAWRSPDELNDLLKLDGAEFGHDLVDVQSDTIFIAPSDDHEQNDWHSEVWKGR